MTFKHWSYARRPLLYLALAGLAGLVMFGVSKLPEYTVPPVAAAATVPSVDVTEERRAFFEAAKAYGRAGCGDMALAELTAKHALRTGLPAGVIAAKVATESTCNPLAVSYKGAVGLTQVMPRVWAEKYDSFRTVNLFNPDQNMRVGTDILSELVKKHGLRVGLMRYLGLGASDGYNTPNSYAERVMKLAGAEAQAKSKEKP